jgi:N6-adenosine-specific RNA methylase IME4
MVAGGDLVSDSVHVPDIHTIYGEEGMPLGPELLKVEPLLAGPVKYDIIYADPTWDYKTWSEKGAGRSAKQHYKITPLEELKQLDVNQLAAKDSLLYMWVTSPNMAAAWELMPAWGFKFVTVGFYWVKLNKNAPETGWRFEDFFMGCGYYSRKNVEQVWIGKKGNGIPRVDCGVRELVIDRRGEHSVKPGEVARRIVQLHGDRPRLEMFARDRKPGWDTWGDEVQSDVVITLKCHNVSSTGRSNGDRPSKSGG